MTRKKFNFSDETANQNNQREYKKITITCIGECGKTKQSSSFFISSNPLYSGTGRFPVCKDCVNKKLPDYKIQDQDELYKAITNKTFILSILNLLEEMNYPFIVKVWTTAIGDAEKSKKHVFGLYMKHFNNTNKESVTFKDGDKASVDDIIRLSTTRGMTTSTLEEEKKEEKKRRNNTVKLEFDNSELNITEDDLVLQRDLLRRLDYDPFVEYSGLDRKQLYQELSSYLEDEGILEDKFLVSILIQIVKSNNQIKKFDDVISVLSTDIENIRNNSAEISKIVAAKKSLQDAVNAIAKENKISVKNRTDAGLKKSTLGYKMTHYRNFGFKDAEENFYDMNVAKGIQVSAEISMTSIFNQLKMSESDYADILQKQATDLVALQKKILDLEEDNRKLNVIIDSYTNDYGKNKELNEYEE